jgi:hypothetical protein
MQRSVNVYGAGIMKAAKILLINSDSARDLACRLRELLESSSCSDIELQQKSVELGETCLRKCDLRSSIKNYDPDLCFLILSPDLLRQVGTLMQSMKETLNKPTIVLIEEGEPFKFLSYSDLVPPILLPHH